MDAKAISLESLLSWIKKLLKSPPSVEPVGEEEVKAKVANNPKPVEAPQIAKPVEALQNPKPKAEVPQKPTITEASVDSCFSRIDVNTLYPPFYKKLRQLVKNCLEKGHRYIVLCGERTWEEQEALYAIGRTTGTPGRFVTKAKPGFSYHNFAIACDFAYDLDPTTEKLQYGMDDKQYKVLAEEAYHLGLDPGGYWSTFKDWPHIQLPASKKGIRLSSLQDAYKQGKKAAVFAFLDSHKDKWE